jgi:hypothetical protein
MRRTLCQTCQTIIAVSIILLAPLVRGQSRDSGPSSPKQQKELSDFFAAPIDLHAFKKKKMSSLSEGTGVNRWFYRPAEAGFFYVYFMFPTPRAYNEGTRAEGFHLLVYKINSSRMANYYDDPTEVLIGIWCDIEDPDLGRANLAGTPLSGLKARFGEPFAINGDTWVYQRNARVLSVHVRGDKIKWFKYLRLSRPIGVREPVPDLLLQTGPIGLDRVRHEGYIGDTSDR